MVDHPVVGAAHIPPLVDDALDDPADDTADDPADDPADDGVMALTVMSATVWR